jgi:hypothetical protein
LLALEKELQRKPNKTDNQPCAVTRLIISSAPINERDGLILDIYIKCRSQEFFVQI